jgi:hypothetical protein
MQLWCLPADFWTAIEKGIQHLSQNTQESTSPPLPFQIPVDPIRNPIRAAFKEQNSIKWKIVYKARLSHKWQQFTKGYVRSKRLDLRAQEGGANSSQQCGITPFEYGNTAMMHSMQIQMHKSNATN